MSAPRRRYRPSAALRLGCVALILLLLAAIVLAWNTQEQLRGMRQDSERIRAQLMADSLSQRIGHAVDIGIPLDALVGVEALFRQRLSAHADIQSIALLQGPGKVLWSTEREGSSQGHGAGTVADAPVVVRGELRGMVRLTLRESGAAPFIRSATVLLLPTVLLLATLAYLAARFSEAQGVKLRNHAVRFAMRAIASGRYDRSVVLPQRRGFDLRAQQLGHAVRGVHETLTRVRRLISSLRQTEPQAQRREYLDKLLAEAQGSHRFSDHGLLQVRVVAAEAQAFWISLLVTLCASALLALSMGANTAAFTVLPGGTLLIPGLFITAMAISARLSQARPWPILSVLFIACAGLGAMALLRAAGVISESDPTLALTAITVGCGVFAGVALTACATVERLPRRQDFKHAMPRWPRAAAAAWLGVVVWLGPALGAITLAALGSTYGALALMLPVLCAGFLLMRWNEPRSPWRYRPSAPTQPATQALVRYPMSSWAIAVGITLAAGLLVARAWLAASTDAPHSHAEQTVACALGIGVLLGLLDPLRRRRQKGAALALAALLNGLVLLLPDTAALHLPALGISALLTAYLLGHSVVTSQRHAPLPMWIILLGTAMGMFAAAGLVAVGAVTVLTFTATLALLGGWWMQPGIRPWQPARRISDAS